MFYIINWFIVGSFLFLQERLAKIEQEEREQIEKNKIEAEKKKHEIEIAEKKARERREEDVDDERMVM